MSGRPDADQAGGATAAADPDARLSARERAVGRASLHVETLVETAILATVDVGGLDHIEDAELSVVLTDDEGIRLLNGVAGQERADQRPVVSGGHARSHPVAPMLGDIVLALETIEREARPRRIPLEAHLTHLVVHGLLHLFGYDHETDSDAEAMEALEIAILATLGIVDPYADRPALRAVS